MREISFNSRLQLRKKNQYDLRPNLRIACHNVLVTIQRINASISQCLVINMAQTMQSIHAAAAPIANKYTIVSIDFAFPSSSLCPVDVFEGSGPSNLIVLSLTADNFELDPFNTCVVSDSARLKTGLRSGTGLRTMVMVGSEKVRKGVTGSLAAMIAASRLP